MASKIFLTGADGFIGSHLTEALVRQGHQVVTFVHYNSLNSNGWLDECPSDIAGHFEIIPGDVRDRERLVQSMNGCSHVLHLASLIAIPYSYVAPQSYIDVNVSGTLNVLMAARASGVERMVHTSTSEVYGSAQFVPISETHPLVGQSPYSASKIAADQLATAFFSSFDLPVVIIRPFNTYGPRQSSRAVIPAIIEQAITNQGRVRLGSVTPTRDFSYVEDTVAGLIAGLNSESIAGETINLGSNFEISIADTVKLIGDVLGMEISLESDADRLRPERSEVNRLFSDNSKALRLLDWVPIYSGENGFRCGLQKTVDWFKHRDHHSAIAKTDYVI